MPPTRPPSDRAPEGRDTDIVIPVMGPTKAGKSFFLNQLLPEGSNGFEVGGRLASCTAVVSSRVLLKAPPQHLLNTVLNGRRIVLVDTPGFDDTYMEDEEVLGRISEWLTKSYRKGMLVGGVIYIHDITRVGSTSKGFAIFSKLCGDNAMDQVAIVTTKWDRLQRLEEGVKAESELRGSPWRGALNAGARLFRLQPADCNDQLSPSHAKPWDIILQLVLAADARHIQDRILHIQDEIINASLPLTETDAGRELQMSLTKLWKKAKELRDQVREDTKAGKATESLRERQRDVEKIITQVEALRPPGLVTRARLWAHRFTWL